VDGIVGVDRMNRGLSGNWNRDTDWQMLIQLRFCVIRIVTFAGPSLIMAPGFIVPPQPDDGPSPGEPLSAPSTAPCAHAPVTLHTPLGRTHLIKLCMCTC